MNSKSSINFDVADWLRERYQIRRAVNQAYSLRAFARDLGVGSGRLSEYMSRKRQVSAMTLCSLVERLEPNRSKAQKILRLAASTSISNRDKTKLEELRLSEDQFSMISEGIHYAILSFLTIDDSGKLNSRSIATKLGYNAIKVAECLERLERLGFIAKSKNKWKVSYLRLSTSEDVSSNALRRAHREVLKMADKSLDTVPVNMREITSITMAIDTAKLPEAKKLIRKFRDDLARLLESGKRDQVYELEIGLFPHSGL